MIQTGVTWLKHLWHICLFDADLPISTIWEKFYSFLTSSRCVHCNNKNIMHCVRVYTCWNKSCSIILDLYVYVNKTNTCISNRISTLQDRNTFYISYSQTKCCLGTRITPSTSSGLKSHRSAVLLYSGLGYEYTLSWMPSVLDLLITGSRNRKINPTTMSPRPQPRVRFH